MKRFSKILTLIVALVVIVTAFTVVALAEDAAEPKAVKPAVMQNNFDHTNWYLGAAWGNPSGGSGTSAIGVAEAYPGGNKFMLITGTSGSSAKSNYNTHFTNVMTGNTDYGIRDYTLGKYPIIALDFDIMTPNGDWGFYSATNAGNSAGISMERVYIGSKTYQDISLLPIGEVSFGNMKMPTTPYLWHHVTMIYEYYKKDVDNGDGTTSTIAYIRLKTYVDGQQVNNSYCTREDVELTSKYSAYNTDNIWIGVVSLSSSRHETASQQALDNFSITYCQEGYDTSSLVTAIYNDTWEAPFGKLVATVTVGEEISYFDDMEEAIAFANANPGCTFAPKQNITANYTVDSVFTIDANIYGTDAETGETIITGKYTGIDTYAKTNVGYLMAETAEGSGIYVATMGDFMHTPKDSIGTAYTADQLVEKLRSPGSGSTIKLLSDIEIDPSLRTKKDSSGKTVNEDGAIRVTTDFTLDLNGYSLRRVYYYGNEYVADENGVYPEEATAVAAKNGALFDMENKAAVLNITSTASTNGKIYNVGVKCDTYVKNGEIEKREIEGFVHNMLIYSITGGAKIDISNTDIYAGKILGAVWGNNFVTVRMNNSNFYQMSKGSASSVKSNGEWVFQFRGDVGYDIQVENSLFYLNAPVDNSYTYDAGFTEYGTTGLFRSNEATPDGKTVISTFKNCDIISAEGKHTAGIFNYNPNETLVFEDCRFYNNDTQDNFVASKGTLSNYGYSDLVNRKYHTYPPIPAAGWSTKNISISLDYTVPAVDGWTATEGEVQSVDFSFGTKTQTCKFNKITTKEVDVKLGDKTVSLIPGVSNIYAEKALRVYKDTESDMLLNKIYLLKDAEGNVIDSILGIYDGKFSFDWENACVLTASEKTAFVGGIKADFNLNFLTGFRYNLYVPADARLSDVVVEGFEKAANTVILYGNEYLVYTKIVGTAAAAEANTISATFKVDGEAYSQTWSINAISYADMLLNYPSDQYPNEKAALGAMAKFIKEAVALTEGSSADVAAIDALIAKSGVSTELGVYTDGNKDCLVPFGSSVKGMQFVVYNGVAAYKFFTEAEDTEISFTVNGENVEFERGSETDEEGNPVYYVVLDAMRVYDIIDPISVTAGGVTAKVSMLDYLTAMEGNAGMELAKALYEFGLAADEYKKDIMANN